MPQDDAAPEPLRSEGAVLLAPIKVHREAAKIVLSQNTRLWFRAAVCFWAMVVCSYPFILYSELFSSQTTRFTCDRSTGVCAVDGRTRDVPQLADITKAEMDHDFNRRDGRNWGINLVTRDGKKHPIEEQRAIKDSVVEDYRTSVKAINAFLADTAQQKLDTSFTYRAGLSEKIMTVFFLFFGIVTVFVGLRMCTRRVYTFDAAKITILVHHPFRTTTREIAADRIASIAVDGALLEVRMDDRSRMVIVYGRQAGPELARWLAGVLGKPVENVSA